MENAYRNIADYDMQRHQSNESLEWEPKHECTKNNKNAGRTTNLITTAISTHIKLDNSETV